MEDIGIQNTPHKGQEMYKTVDNVKWVRLPVKTRLFVIGDKLNTLLDEYIKPYAQADDVVGITSKVISIVEGFYVKESDIKITWLARFLVRFVKKWPHDPGFALPQKIQLAMNIVGMPRFIFAMIGGAIMKVLGQPGWFYRLAGHNINAIDGFVPEMYPVPLRGYGFLAPENPDKIADDIEKYVGNPIALLDGNNVENIVLGMSDKLVQKFGGDYQKSKEYFLKIIEGNPQGQTGNTPILLVRKEQ